MYRHDDTSTMHKKRFAICGRRGFTVPNNCFVIDELVNLAAMYQLSNEHHRRAAISVVRH